MTIAARGEVPPDVETEFGRRLESVADRFEAVFALMAVAAFLAVAFLCCDRVLPHADEVMYAETSANIAEGRGPVAWTHANVVPGTANALAYVPFVYAEAAWIRMFGFSRFAVQSFSIVVVAGAAMLFWAFLRRSRLIPSAAERLFLVAAMPLLPSVVTLYWTNRYDVVAVFGVALAAWATTVPIPGCRLTLLWIAGVLVGGDGFHAAVVTPCLAGVAWLYGGRRDTAALVAYGSGVACGIVLTFGEMWASGTLGVFRLLMEHNKVAVRGLGKVLAAPFAVHSNFRENLLMMVALMVALLAGWRQRGGGAWKNAAALGLGVNTLVPMTLTLIGRYNHTYSWLAALPAYLLAVMAAGNAAVGPLARWVILAVLALDAASGLPMRAVMTALESERNSHSAPSQFIRDHIGPADVVYASYSLYYPVKTLASESFFGGVIESMSVDQAARVDKAVLADDAKPNGLFEVKQAEALKRLGGEWEEVGHYRIPRGPWRMMVPPKPKDTAIFDFKVFRRVR